MKLIKNLYKTPVGVAGMAAIFFGLIVHMFGLTNVMHNCDDIVVQPQGVGTTLPSGRWFLYVLYHMGKIFTGNFNLPWLNGLLFILLLGVSAAFLVSALKIERKTFAAIIGAGLVSFPSITSVLFFKFTAPQYGLAILFSVMAVWTAEKWKYGFLLSMCLIALSLGTYQAYFPVTVSVFLILLIKYSLREDTKLSALIKRGFLYLVTMISGLLLYFVVLKVMLKLRNVSLLGYQGIDNMGKISLNSIPELLWETIKGFIVLPINDYCNLATSPILKLAYLIIYMAFVILVVLLIIKNKKKPEHIFVISGLCVLLPISINLIVIMGAASIYTLMVFPFFLLLCVPIVLLELFERDGSGFSKVQKWMKTCVVSTILVIIFSNSYFANVNYSSMYFSNRQVENFYNSITTQIHSTQGYDTSKTWAFIGKVDEKFFNQSVWGEQHTYGGNKQAASQLINSYCGKNWVFNYLGYRYTAASDSEKEILKQRYEVQEMPCWPDQGSVKVIDNYVVIKLSD